MSAQPMFPHYPGHVQTRDLYVRASLGHAITSTEVLALLDDLECAQAELRDAEKRAKDDAEEWGEEVDRYEADIASLNDTITKRVDEVDELSDKLTAIEEAGITPEYVATVEAERDAAIESRDAIAQAAQTWTTAKLSSFILETAERQRLENESLRAEVKRLSAGVQRPLTMPNQAL